MLKYKDGKFMVVNMALLFIMAIAGVYVATLYGTSKMYTYGIFAIGIVTVILATLQVVFARNLYRIAKEESKVQSNTAIEEKPEK